MDPLTALGLAANVVQFVDFGSKLVSKGLQLYRSEDGALSENVEMDLATQDLMKLTVKLKDSIPSKWDFHKLNDDDVELIYLCDGCEAIGQELITRLNQLKVSGQHRRWKSMRQAIKSVWTKDDVDAVARRLKAFRDQLDTHILVSLRQRMDIMSIQQSAQFTALDQSSQELMARLEESRQAIAKDLEAQTIALAKLQRDEHEKTRIAIRAEIEETRKLVVESELEQPPPTAERKIDTILDSLYSPHMWLRYDELVKAHVDTFEWVFCEPDPQTARWSNFDEWLGYGDGVYWINGKAASGKSTLMRFINEHYRTREQLSLWAGGDALSTAAFFFWNSGTPDQRSQIGLLRSLLYQILGQYREIIPVVLPEIWAFKRLKSLSSTFWSLARLMNAFRALMKQDAYALKLCMFIDGLDEFEGDHEDMAELFKSISSINVKICVSSRPLIVFEDAFYGLPYLRLQDLTYNDITRYVDDKLSKNQKMVRLVQEDPVRAPALVVEIVTKADGVFLWVKLTVKSLLDGLGNRDRVSDLQRRLRLIPADLEDLYGLMLKRIGQFYLEQASRTFQIMRAAGQAGEVRRTQEQQRDWAPLSIVSLSFAEEEDINTALDAEIGLLPIDELESRCVATEGRLKSRCAGLLESHGPEESYRRHISYLHRTAKDFLEEPGIWSMLLACTAGSDFNPHKSLFSSYILRLKWQTVLYSTRCDDYDSNYLTFWDLMNTAVLYARHAEEETARAQVSLVEELDRTATHHDPEWKFRMITDAKTLPSAGELDGPFLAFLTQRGLALYLETRLNTQNSILQHWIGRPLLDYAVDPLVETQDDYTGASPATISVLLKSGANPNELFRDATPWQRVLAYVFYYLRLRAAPLIPDENEHRQEWIKILELFVTHNVNPRARVPWKKDGAPWKDGPGARHVITETLTTVAPEAAAKLLQLLDMSTFESSSESPQISVTRSLPLIPPESDQIGSSQPSVTAKTGPKPIHHHPSKPIIPSNRPTKPDSSLRFFLCCIRPGK